MQTKTYFASSVPAAFEVARKELGEEALFVNSGQTPIAFRHFGRFEVTFGWEPAEKPAAAIGLSGKLAEAGFSREIAELIVPAVDCAAGAPEAAVIRELIREFARRIPVAPAVEAAPGDCRTLALVGPPGRGKSTSLIKLATRLGLSRGMPVRIYSAGQHRLGATEQMARFAGDIGATWRGCESLAGLGLALSRGVWRGLTLIDTPGISPQNQREYAGLTEFFSAHRTIETHLVLRADATSADMLGMVSRFSRLNPARLLFTGMDEAASRAPMIETLIRSGIPAAFLGTGQQMPADLEAVDPQRLAESVWAPGAQPERAMHALAAA